MRGPETPPPGGPFQFIASTYRAYQDPPGTSSNHRDTFGQACAFINYATRKYDVSWAATDLAAKKIQQADPRRSPKGLLSNVNSNRV